jgi:hypothetical protein
LPGHRECVRCEAIADDSAGDDRAQIINPLGREQPPSYGASWVWKSSFFREVKKWTEALLRFDGGSTCNIWSSAAASNDTDRPIALSPGIPDTVDTDISDVLAAIVLSYLGQNERLKFSH